MRVLLSTIGSRGDVQPLVALALQLKSAGQDVRMCVPHFHSLDRSGAAHDRVGKGAVLRAGSVTGAPSATRGSDGRDAIRDDRRRR